LAIGLSAAAAAEEQALGLQPPAPVACAAKACDRDPAQLADFAVRFYAWYVDTTIAEDNLTGAARRRNERAHAAILDRMLSPAFRAKLAKLRKEMAASKGDIPEPDPSLSSLCGGAEADNILCAQDYDGRWRTDASAKIDTSAPGTVRLTVTLPWPADPTTKARPRPHLLVVTLVPDRGYWSIDRIAAGD
jgi:hypothetical protein